MPVFHAPEGIVQNEHSIMRWAAAADFDVPTTEILRAEDLRGLPRRFDPEMPIYVIERFDRSGEDRIHQEDFAQVIGITPEDAVSSQVPFGYGGLGRLVHHILGQEGVEEYVCRLALIRSPRWSGPSV